MICPKCKSDSSVVTDTRYKTGSIPDHTIKWRRRECSVCSCKYTTYEIDGELFGKIKRIKQIQASVIAVGNRFFDLIKEVKEIDESEELISKDRIEVKNPEPPPLHDVEKKACGECGEKFWPNGDIKRYNAEDFCCQVCNIYFTKAMENSGESE